MQATFAYYNPSSARWVGNFRTTASAIAHAGIEGLHLDDDALLTIWHDAIVSRTPTPRREPASPPAGSLAAFLALGQ